MLCFEACIVRLCYVIVFNRFSFSVIIHFFVFLVMCESAFAETRFITVFGGWRLHSPTKGSESGVVSNLTHTALILYYFCTFVSTSFNVTVETAATLPV